MAIPQRPGVYLNEVLTPLASVDQSTGRSTAVFVGTNATGGPTNPTLVTSWQQFSNLYGGFGTGSDLLPFSVYEFFNNGGASCYVVRAANATAVAASVSMADGEGTPKNIVFTAQSVGAWGNNIAVEIDPGGLASTVNVTITNTLNGALLATEVYQNVSLDPSVTNTRNLLSVINGASNLVTVSASMPTGTFSPSFNPVPGVATNLTGGADGTGTPDLVAAAQRIGSLPGTFDVNLPGVNTAATINSLATWAVSQGNVFLVVDGVPGASSDTAAVNASAQRTLVTTGGLSPSSSIAVYGPWLMANDPTSAVASATRLLPPGGFVLGQYARTDTLRGVQKAAAGLDTSLRGVLGPQFIYANADLDSLNTAGVNVLKAVPGAGTVIFGARTLSKGMPDQYLNIRRTLINLKDGLQSITQFAAFENNDDSLRLRVTNIVEQYLRTQWAAGMLSGASEGQAFYVICDGSNNTAATISSGVVNISVGLALQYPAEFIVFNIGQTTSGSTVSA